jgi:hypothetical protein
MRAAAPRAPCVKSSLLRWHLLSHMCLSPGRSASSTTMIDGDLALSLSPTCVRKSICGQPQVGAGRVSC